MPDDTMAAAHAAYYARKRRLDTARHALGELLQNRDMGSKRDAEILALIDALKKDSDHIVAVWD